MKTREYRNWVKQKLNIGEELLYLSMQDVKDTQISVEDIIELTEKALIAYSENKTEMPIKMGLHLQSDYGIHSYLLNEFAGGIRWGSHFSTNREQYPVVTPKNCQIIYNDHQKGCCRQKLAVQNLLHIRNMRLD